MVDDADDELPEDQQEGVDDVEGDIQLKGGQAVLAGSDWTAQTILDQLTRGNIQLDPIFQRRDAWKSDRKSRFIESLILGFPVPQIVLAEKPKSRGRYIVIDGKQRLLSIRQFAAKEDDTEYAQLKLAGLQIRKDLNGLSYRDIQTDPEWDADLTAFENQTIRTVVIKNWPDEKFLYAVFLRLNTGSVPLSPQELRQALHPGPFSDYVNTYAVDSTVLQSILRLNAPDFRMRDTELVLRFLAFQRFLHNYNGNLKELLDEVTQTYNDSWQIEKPRIEKRLRRFESALKTTVKIFGEGNALKKWNGASYEKRINRAVFDIMVHYFKDKEVATAALAKSKDVVDAFRRVCAKNQRFRASIEKTTKAIPAIFSRFLIWGETLAEVLDMELQLPRMENERIQLR